MSKSNKFIKIGVGILITVVIYSIILYILLHRLYPEYWIGMSAADAIFLSNLWYIIILLLVGVCLIYSGYNQRRLEKKYTLKEDMR